MKKPDFIVWITHENTPASGSEPNTYWLRVGAAFRHREGNGLNIVLTPGIAITSGKLVLLEPKEKDPTDDNNNPYNFN
ncbi:hypothetical protein NG99_24355 [Erwinia typographi]|uniref:Uncharacterized protein n=1 Tax=Erwinia typographi TaxID=371042 RepID=A0A0A3ZMU9_9GAMM|nr:hypothetical protein [Erwinia typographi]KGT87013.1 hypothetical protein NG99_24355 [Erwinia typographi]